MIAIDLSKIIKTGFTMTVASSLSTPGCNLSGPKDLCMFDSFCVPWPCPPSRVSLPHSSLSHWSQGNFLKSNLTCKHQHEEGIEYLDLFQILCHQDLCLSTVNATISLVFLSGLYETQQSLHDTLDTSSQQTAKPPREHVRSADEEPHSLQQRVSLCYDSNGI